MRVCVYCVVCVYFCLPLVLWYCWLGLLTCKTVSQITYTVLVETLNPTYSLTYCTWCSNAKYHATVYVCVDHTCLSATPAWSLVLVVCSQVVQVVLITAYFTGVLLFAGSLLTAVNMDIGWQNLHCIAHHLAFLLSDKCAMFGFSVCLFICLVSCCLFPHPDLHAAIVRPRASKFGMMTKHGRPYPYPTHIFAAPPMYICQPFALQLQHFVRKIVQVRLVQVRLWLGPVWLGRYTWSISPPFKQVVVTELHCLRLSWPIKALRNAARRLVTASRILWGCLYRFSFPNLGAELRVVVKSMLFIESLCVISFKPLYKQGLAE